MDELIQEIDVTGRFSPVPTPRVGENVTINNKQGVVLEITWVVLPLWSVHITLTDYGEI